MTRVFKAAVAGACLSCLGLHGTQARADDGDAGSAAAAAPATADAKAPQVTATDADGVFTINGTEAITAPRKVVFAVISDYAHMTSFVTSLKSSTVTAHQGTQLTVTQEATGKAGPFSKEVHTILSVTKKPTSKLTFVDTEKKDFDQYQGSWTLHGTGSSTTATYQLIAKPKGMAPGGIAKKSFQEGIEKMMAEVRTEAEKRAAATP